MSDILIRGMEKPGSCRECDFCEVQDINFEIFYFCNMNDRFLDDEEACNIPNDCPIIELPEHGDLIDRSKLSFVCGGTAPAEMDYVRRYVVDGMPVIVPSNKEESE